MLVMLAITLHLWASYRIHHDNSVTTLNSASKQSLAYVFLLTSVKYERMTRKAIASLQQYDFTTPIILMTYKHRVHPPLPNVTMWPVKRLFNLGRFQWKDTFAKFEIATLTQFDRVMFFDSDVLFFSSPKRFFNEAPNADIVAPYAYWIGDGASVFSTGGPLIIRPSASLFAEVRAGKLLKVYDGEMDYFNEYAQSHKTVALTNPSFVLVGEYFPGDPIYRHYNESPSTLTMVHFIANWKPPLAPERLRKMPAEIQDIYECWERLPPRL